MNWIVWILSIVLTCQYSYGADYVGEAIVSWTGTGLAGDNFRADLDKYEIKKWLDKTSQLAIPSPIKEPNQFVVYIEADNSTILKMKDDGIVVLWMEPKVGAKTPPKQTKVQLDTLKADLAAKGVLSADIAKTALGDTSKADVTAVDVAVQLKAMMAEFPAATKVEEVGK
jgi:hypothetical protein